MSLFAPFEEALKVLGVGPDDGHVAFKRAYRRLVAEHPPDVDEAGFRRVREAYELLVDPIARAKTMLQSVRPMTKPSALVVPGDAEPPARMLANALLRRVAARVQFEDEAS